MSNFHFCSLGIHQFSPDIICDVCQRKGDSTGLAYSCSSCEIELCPTCWSKLSDKLPDKRHVHKLYLRKRNFICDICHENKPNTKRLSMYCSNCDYDICMKCYLG